MKEQLISFETAKLAKEKGFNEYVNSVLAESTPKCELYNFKIIDTDGEIVPCCNSSLTEFVNTQNERFYSAPTQSLLQKWLREKHKLYLTINVATYMEEGKYSAELSGYGKKHFMSPLIDGFTIYKTYEEALEEGLIEALNLI